MAEYTSPNIGFIYRNKSIHQVQLKVISTNYPTKDNL